MKFGNELPNPFPLRTRSALSGAWKMKEMLRQMNMMFYTAFTCLPVYSAQLAYCNGTTLNIFGDSKYVGRPAIFSSSKLKKKRQLF